MVKETDRLGERIRDALRDPAAALHVSDDFARRLDAAVRPATGVMRLRLSRGAKVAAAVALMASFAGFAAWVGVTVYEGGRRTAASEPALSADSETEMLSNQGENTMIARKMATLVGAAMVSVAVPAEELTSEPTFVFLRPETSSFWNTATNNTMTVPVDYPSGATAATLAVSGLGYAQTYAGITGDEFTFALPTPTSPETENVYDLTLTFNDAAATTRTAKLGLVQGLSPDAEGTTRCLAPATAKVWRKATGRAVLPIPYGTTSFTVNGVETDTGLNGAQGWFAIGGINPNENVSLSLMAGGVEYAASLLGGGAGLMLIFK